MINQLIQFMRESDPLFTKISSKISPLYKATINYCTTTKSYVFQVLDIPEVLVYVQSDDPMELSENLEVLLDYKLYKDGKLPIPTVIDKGDQFYVRCMKSYLTMDFKEV